MTIFNYIPRTLRVALLNQPIPEHWKNELEHSLEFKESDAINENLNLGRKANYNIIAALCILFISGFIIFIIIN